MRRSSLALAALALSFLAPPTRAADAGGTASGKLTVNGKTVTLKHAYARRVKGAIDDSGRFAMREPFEGEKPAEGTFVVLTDVPLPGGDLTYLSVVTTAFAERKVQGISWAVDDKKQASEQSMHHAALSKEVPGSPDSFELSRLDAHIAGKATADGDFFDDKWTYQVSFDAPVAPLPKASMAAGTVSGKLTFDGKVYELRAVAARTEPGAFDKKQKQYVVDLTDVPVPPATLAKTFEMMDMTRAGKVHGIRVTIDAAQRVISGGFYLAGLEMASSTGWQQFEAAAFDGHTIEGRLYTKQPEDIFDHKLELDVLFNVAPTPK
jgi:hypothetical protein